jgi:tRNA threonylcarbamoyladenosine biosynthesis protein TsaB
MKILALETSTEFASLALLCAGELRTLTLSNPPAHSATLLPALRQLLAEAQVSLAQLDVIACGIGPGAFTGVRLACSVAQGLALGADLPVAPVCSLLALAQAQRPAEKVYCAMDARMNEAYVAAYQRDGEGWTTVLAPSCVGSAAWPTPPSAGWIGVGTGFRAFPLEPGSELATHVTLLDPAAIPAAAAVAALAGQVPWLDAAALAPLYVRDRVAQTVAERLASGGKA